MNPPTVSVALVTFNRRAQLKTCIDAVLAQNARIDKILVLDNGSTDGTHELVAKLTATSEYQMIEFVRTTSNLGGAGGFAFALENLLSTTNSSHFWLVEDDIKPAINCLHRLLKAAEHADVVQPSRYYLDGTYAAFMYKRLNHTNPFKSFHLDRIESADRTSCQPIPVVNFAFEGPLLSRDIINKVGLPDASYFILFDDTDFATRILSQQGEIHYLPSAIVERLEQHPSPQSHDWKEFFAIRNKVIYNFKYAPIWVSSVRLFVAFSRAFIGCLIKAKPWKTWKMVITAYVEGAVGHINNDRDRWN